MGHGSRAPLSPASEQERRFASWLGIVIEEGAGRPYERLEIGFDERGLLRGLSARLPRATAAVLDLTPLGFGPCAALVTDDELVWKRAERLKIFGSFDLRTMWTQQEQSSDLQVGVQFNYRLSPLVGACARLALLQPEVKEKEAVSC